MTEAPQITAINLEARFATFDDDTTGPITDMFDEDGDDTTDPTEAVSIIIEHKASGRYYVELPDEFVARVIQ